MFFLLLIVFVAMPALAQQGPVKIITPTAAKGTASTSTATPMQRQLLTTLKVVQKLDARVTTLEQAAGAGKTAATTTATAAATTVAATTATPDYITEKELRDALYKGTVQLDGPAHRRLKAAVAKIGEGQTSLASKLDELATKVAALEPRLGEVETSLAGREEDPEVANLRTEVNDLKEEVFDLGVATEGKKGGYDGDEREAAKERIRERIRARRANASYGYSG